MAGPQDCIDVIRKAAGEDLSDEQLADILELLEARAARFQADDPSLSPEAAFARAADALGAEKKLAALIEKRSRMINALRKKARLDYYAQVEGSGGSVSTALHAINVGREGPFEGAGRSVDAVKHAIEGELLGGLVNDLRQAGLLEVAKLRDPNFEINVAREMSRQNGGIGIQPTGDRHAEAMAKIFVKYVEAARIMQNEAGAFIRKLPGYVTRQSHDQLKIMKAGYEAWKSHILPLLDNRTFDEVSDVDAFLRSIYNNVATGNHLKADGQSDWLGGFKGPGNLAKKVSAERILQFKGPDEWIAYNNRFGRTSLYESVIDNLGFAARNTALMRTWGTNPEAAFRADLDQAILKAKRDDRLDEVKQLSNWIMQAEFDQISGGTQMYGSAKAASINGAIRSVISMAKLGGVVLSSIPDIAVRASVLRHNGVGLLQSYGNSLSSFLSAFKGSEKREVADLLGVGLQGVLGGAFERFHGTDSPPGTFNKLSNLFFKATGLTWWTDALSRGAGLMLARNLANQIKSGLAHSGLNSRLQTTLKRYGIGESEWAALRQADLRIAEGEDFLTPEAVRALPDSVMGKREREKLAESLSTYYSDQVREALTFGGAREKALATWGTSSGTPIGEAVRYVMQFKQFPITFITKHLGREFKRGGGVDTAGIAHLIVASTVLGYIAMTAKEYAKGRNPRDLEDPKDWAKVTMAAMAQGGGMGIYGDFLFGNANRLGGGLVGTIAGPGAGLLEQYTNVLYAARDGKDPRAKALKAVEDSTPFLNLFYTRLALDHMILYSWMEAMNPGYLRRYERTIERENNQTFWLPPTSAD